ncbi:MAG: LacI family DNA-binding transcriptional regulator [Betaproteobacteria bacterium]
MPKPNPSSQFVRADHGAAAPQPRRRISHAKATPGLAEVAGAARVSTASASRALTRPELVSESMRARVLDAVAALGYVANPAARSLSTRRPDLVGAVLRTPTDPIALQMLEAAEGALVAHGIGVLLRIACAAVPEAACARALAARGVSGVVFIGGAIAPETTLWSPGRAVPYIGCGQPPGLDGAAAAGETFQRRGRALVEQYLIQLGHRRIGAIGLRREEGAAQKAPRQNAVVIDLEVDDLDDGDAVRTATRLLVQSQVTAIVAASDVAAAAALGECQALSLAVPHQISVVGWGDSGLARCLHPMLTSVRIQARASGRSAAEYLVAAMAGREFVWRDLPPKLVIRESTGPGVD